MRTEKDELGEIQIPDNAFYGTQTARAMENFSLGYKRVSLKLIYAMVKVKKAAALCLVKLASQDEALKYRAIAQACDEVLQGKADDQFKIDALQGGAGTSTNMNVNEVLANLALEILGKPRGAYAIIHPLDHVNRLQSTNDVYPTSLRIAAIDLLRELSDNCARLQESLQKKETEYSGIKKLGRTELMDAVPITLGEEFGAYAQAIGRDRWRLYKVEERLRQVNLGGAAVGLAGKNEKLYHHGVLEQLREITGMGLAAAEYPMDLTQNCDVFVEVSGLLKSLGVNLTKIANDLRLMNSGPRGGLGEIRLAPMQKGSSIMPGKVNPVIPEMAIQVGIKVAANDFAITAAASRGEFELNAFSPLIADALLESLLLLCRTVRIFRTKCIETLEPVEGRCAALLENSCAFAASYVPRLGYDTVNRIIAENNGDPERVRQALDLL
ncbi:aspartate ammonia-lyase [Leadbettera azotonutricia]|uniref:Aspartate ammonia-lyase (Aspartase) n=1 Tax=Leadbettera azotonutricia (strain ATCC BAA-888 / DSM 13862 / ZAS-9) TaxID=545695 RepID=F5YBP6_LEAAZ|nr:aspartate ammonia-lyase [Leadbettera azotonutricia]AEF80288.1 aspartate ammonia-lyase (Aspartase) [Leadbettera azotonutricia ZAS-9]